MTTFDSREKGFENKFAHEEELAFKTRSRRNYLLGLWAAENLGKSGDDAEGYARQFVLTALDKPSDNCIVQHLAKELADKTPAPSEKTILGQMEALYDKAKKEIRGDAQ
jgi:hypothetical protein